MQAGAVNIKLMADIADVQQKFAEIEKISKQTANGMQGVFSSSLGNIGAKIAGALSVGAFSMWMKSAIDAADETSKLAQKAGIAVNQVAGLQLAFRQSGLEAGALQTSMSKLSVAIAGGNDALIAMGIQTKSTNGTLKSTRQVLGEVADKFAGYQDGAAKTALAVQIFGKSGADLIPLLNGGSEALDQFDDMARKLGLTLDDETAKNAEKFNDTVDLMGQGLVGIGRQIAAQILPTLTNLADQFFTTMTEGDRLKRIADALGFGLKALYSVAILVIEAFSTVGKTIGAAAAQIMAVMNGDFSAAAKIGNEWASDVKKDWVGALKNLEGAWSDTGGSSIDTMASMAGAARKNAPVVNEETKKMADEQRKLEESYKKLINSIEDKTGSMLLEAQGTEKLTDGQKLALKTMQDLQNGVLKLTDSQKKNVTATLEAMLATEQQVNAQKDLEKTTLAAQTLANKFTDAQWKEADSLRDANIKLIQQNDVLRLGASAVREREITVLRSTATDLEWKAANEGGNAALEEQARLLRQRANLMEDNTVLEEAKKAADEWEKTSNSIESSLTDALMRGFESGKDFGKNLADTLINMFKTLVLRPIIQPVAQGAAGMVTSALGLSASSSAAAASGGGGLAGATGMLGAVGAFGSYAATGFMASATGIGLGTSLGAAGALMEGGSIVAGLGMGLGAVVPYVAAFAAAVALLNSAFGGDQSTTGGGISGSLNTFGASIQTFKEITEDGGWFSSDDVWKEFSAVDKTIQKFFNEATTNVYLATRSYAKALGLSTVAIEGFTQQIEISLMGLDADEQKAKLAEAVTGFQEAMSAQFADVLEPLQAAGETFTQTLQRLVQIQEVSGYLNEFGGAFAAFATSSVAARQNIIDLAGGLDQLVQKTQGFVANFYTREEQAAITARGVVQALGTAGFTEAQIAALETRADFRTLLESIDVSTDIGQQQFVTLLNIQDLYSQSVPIMEEQSKSLIELIAAAPQVEMLQKMFETDAEYQTRVQTAEELAQETYDRMVTQLGVIDVTLNGLTAVIDNGLEQIAQSTAGAIAAANVAAQQAIAAAQESAARAAEAERAAATQAAMAAAIAATASWTGDGAATGGYISGPTLVGEHGPEIFNPQTSQIYTAPATASMLGGGDVAIEIRALRDEVTSMRAETRATAVNTSKIAKLQDNWDVRGLTVKTDTDQPLNTVAA